MHNLFPISNENPQLMNKITLYSQQIFVYVIKQSKMLLHSNL